MCSFKTRQTCQKINPKNSSSNEVTLPDKNQAKPIEEHQNAEETSDSKELDYDESSAHNTCEFGSQETSEQDNSVHSSTDLSFDHEMNERNQFPLASIALQFQRLEDHSSSNGIPSEQPIEGELSPECFSEFRSDPESEVAKQPERSSDQEAYNFSSIININPLYTTLSQLEKIPKKRVLTKSKTNPEIGHSCECPNVLICDDDRFQHLFYQNFFERIIGLDQIGESKNNLKMESFLSGEELLLKYQKLKACKCSKLSLVISDYSMGENKLNGVETVLAVRDAGFQGAVVLRTSETRHDLIKDHSNFEELIRTGSITSYVEKAFVMNLKTVIYNCIKKN